MQERLSSLPARHEAKRTFVTWAMEKLGLERHQAPYFTLFLRSSPPRLEISDEEKIPGEFFISQAPRLDRSGLSTALRRGDPIDGACLALGERGLTVRVR